MSAIAFWKGAGERAGKSALQAFVGTLGLQSLGVVTPEIAAHLPWYTAFLTAAMMAVLSLATSILNPSFTAGNGGAIEPLPTVPDIEPEDGYAVPEFDADSGEEPRHAEGNQAEASA